MKFREKSKIKVGDKVHTPSGYAKVISIAGDKVVVRSQDPVGEFEYKLSQVSKESFKEKDTVAFIDGERKVLTLSGSGKKATDEEGNEYVKIGGTWQMESVTFRKKLENIKGESKEYTNFREKLNKIHEGMGKTKSGKFKLGDKVKCPSGKIGKITNITQDLIKVRDEQGNIKMFDEDELKKL